jgi:hypothetical protein
MWQYEKAHLTTAPSGFALWQLQYFLSRPAVDTSITLRPYTMFTIKTIFASGGGGSFSIGDCEYQRGKLFRTLSQLRPRIRPLVPKCCTLRKVKKRIYHLWRRFVVIRESTTRIILAMGTKIWFFKTGPLVLVNLVRKDPLQVNFLDNDIWHCFLSF